MEQQEDVLGVIGGSGLYEMEGLSDVESVVLQTPFGKPSDAYVTGRLNGLKVAFLPRHGRGHRLLPSEVNYRANIHGMKQLGVTRLISVSAVGSMKEEIEPGHIVIPDQFIDRTNGSRGSTFFGNGVVAHVQFADPVCPCLSSVIADAARKSGARVHQGGTYLCMEGPAFSTRAESLVYRSLGVSVIGMTNIPEAKLAREAELCYGVIALATDYDCWHTSHDDVSVDAILKIIAQNVATAKSIIRNVISGVGTERNCGCKDALRYALITDRSVIPDQARRDLALIVGKYLD